MVVGVGAPMINRLSPWTALILGPWLVASRFPSRWRKTPLVTGAGTPHQLPCDAPTASRDVQDGSLMAVVEVMSVGCMDRWTHGSKCFQPCPFDQTNIKPTLLIHPRCAWAMHYWCPRSVKWQLAGEDAPLGVGAPAMCGQVVRACPLMVYLHMKFTHNSWNFIST
jgi:hypothetical protein